MIEKQSSRIKQLEDAKDELGEAKSVIAANIIYQRDRRDEEQ